MTRTGFQRALPILSSDHRKAILWEELFWAISDLCPEDIRNLRKRVFPFYQRINWVELGGADYHNLEAWAEAIRSDQRHTDHDKDVLALYDGLIAWGKRLWIDHREAYEQVFLMFREWEPAPEPEHSRSGKGGFFRVLGSPFRLSTHGWLPQREPETFFRRRVEEEFREALDFYVELVRKEVYANGWREEPRRKSLFDHMDWLVLRQCRGWGYAEIRRALGLKVGRSTVRDAQEKLARELGLTLRPVQRGRPKE